VVYHVSVSGYVSVCFTRIYPEFRKSCSGEVSVWCSSLQVNTWISDSVETFRSKCLFLNIIICKFSHTVEVYILKMYTHFFGLCMLLGADIDETLLVGVYVHMQNFVECMAGLWSLCGFQTMFCMNLYMWCGLVHVKAPHESKC
jgi:hypothetical protein